MGRRRSPSDDLAAALRDFFMMMPWWVCPIVAGGMYLVLAYLFPFLFASNQVLEALGGLSRLFAPYIAATTLLVGLVINARKLGSSMMLDRQRGSDTIAALSWREFEMLLAAAFRRQGYSVLETGGGGADGGVDLVLHGNGEKVAVQCKHWRSRKVGVTLIRELNGVIRARTSTINRGIFVTFGDFTQEARRFAKQNGIELLDRPALLAMIDAVRKDTPPTSAVPSCPLCGSPMALRTARQGSNAGSQFWGCSTYPKCRGTMSRD